MEVPPPSTVVESASVAPPSTDPESEAVRVAWEMATRHSLEVIGFETASIDAQAVHEVASALDDLLVKYPIPLRGIEITEGRDEANSRSVRNRLSQSEPPGEPALWIVLDRSSLVPPAGSVPREGRRRGLRRRSAERPVYLAVVREFAAALDIAGGFRARQEAMRALVAESLRGGGGGQGLLDPGRALVEGFTEVVLRGERAGELAKVLHGALVKMARAESADLSA
ncbi:hypothetical protein [Nocardia amamiensis]|uniref:hypothetical protein n=1 Tax=Nocardia amamiensis TaxID=404578 RepID=UPI0012F48886|nr:hypothetical protein [Nocardia amamiensis]